MGEVINMKEWEEYDTQLESITESIFHLKYPHASHNWRQQILWDYTAWLTH